MRRQKYKINGLLKVIGYGLLVIEAALASHSFRLAGQGIALTLHHGEGEFAAARNGGTVIVASTRGI